VGSSASRTQVEREIFIELRSYDIAWDNQHLLECSTNLRLTAYNNSLLGKDDVSLKEKVTCIDEHDEDVSLGNITSDY
jgi:hypothetical protein